jgi:hypothetical protein
MSFLEYLAYKVMPEWNKTELALTDALTYPGDETKKAMYK